MTKDFKPIALDTETSGFDAMYNTDADLWCVGYSYSGGSDCLRWDDPDLHTRLHDVTRSGKYKLVFHNAAFDVSVLRRRGIQIQPGSYHDTMLMAYCLFPGQSVSLDNLAKEYLGERKNVKPNFDKYTEEMRVYCELDADLTYRLFLELHKELQAWPEAWEFYKTVELPYCERIIEMQTRGVQIDWEAHEKYKIEESNLLNDIHSSFFTFKEVRRGMPMSDSNSKQASITKDNVLGIVAKEKFNPDSSRHIAEVLTRRGHKLPLSDKGNPKTDKNTLDNLEYDEFIDTLRDYRKHRIIVQTFLPAMSNNNFLGRVYGSFNQASVRTGRLSSSEPNLQNIPGRDERGAVMRRMFTAPGNSLLLVGDLDRIELVVLGFYLESVLGYTALSDRIKTGEDVHQSNTDEWGGIAGIELQRKKCKNGQFALVYGCGSKKFSNTVGIPVDAAKKIFEQSEIIAAIHELRDILVREARRNEGMLTNFYGRNLFIPEVCSHKGNVRAMGDRLALNYTIQSTAGDTFKILQLDATSLLLQHEELMQLIVVHDEDIYEYHLPFIPGMMGVSEDKSIKENKASVLNLCRDLSNTFSTDNLLNDGSTWASVRCKYYAASNWWLAKIAEDVVDEYAQGITKDDIAERNSLTPAEVDHIIHWNVEDNYAIK